MNEVTTVNSALGVFDPNGFEAAMKVAESLMRSSLVPQMYQAGAKADQNHQARANVLIALNMSKRMNADPLMVMQNLYIVHGKPAWSSQFLIACFNSCGRFSAIQYKFSGEPDTDDYGCYAWAVEHSTGSKIEGEKITISMAKKEGWFSKNGSKWQTMPGQMLRYRAATFFIRTTAPEIAMGLQTSEEAEDMRDVTPQAELPKEKTPKYAGSKVRAHGLKEPEKSIDVETESAEPETVNPETGEVKRTIDEYGKVVTEPRKKTQQEILAEEMAKQKETELDASWEPYDGQ